MAQVAPIPLQQSFWNRWNAGHREEAVGEVSRRQAEVVCGWLDSLGRTDLDILEVGCGTGWLCPQLVRFGRVTATDLSDEVLARAQHRLPEVGFVPGDFMQLEFGKSSFDAIVTLEVLSHVLDQKAFVKKLASHLRPGGLLMLATQNRVVLQYLNFLPPPAPGQLRQWVDRRELRSLLESELEVLELFAVTPKVGSGLRSGLGLRRWIRSVAQTAPRAGASHHRTDPDTRSIDDDGTCMRPRRWATERLEAMGLGWTLMALARRRSDLTRHAV